MRDLAQKPSLGFTLTELMVSLVLSSLLMAGAYRLIIGQSESSTRAMQLSNIKRQMQQSRQLLNDKIRFAGYNAYEEAVLFANSERLKIWSDTELTELDGNEEEGLIDEREAVEFRFVNGTLYEIPVTPQNDDLVDRPRDNAPDDWDGLYPVAPQEEWTPIVHGITALLFEYDIEQLDGTIVENVTTPTAAELPFIRAVSLKYTLHDGGLTADQIRAQLESGELQGKAHVGTASVEKFSIRLENRS